MFSKSNQASKGSRFSVIGPDVVITGDFTTGENLQIDGRIEGDVRCAVLLQGASGAITGNIHAEEARLAGTVDGTLSARIVTLETTARVTGEVAYTTLSIENGARVDGRFAHREDACDQPLTELFIDDEKIMSEAAE